MSEFLVYLQLGFAHITDLAAVDHIFFLVALAAIYRFRDWRDALWVISAFTVGHSLTLVLAVTGAFRPPEPLIEFLIPVTIVATAAENLLVADRTRAFWGGGYRPIFSGIFGLVHGAGFASYLRSLFVEQIAVPLLGFNAGIELGQIVVLVLVLLLLSGFDRVLEAMRLRLPRSAPAPLRLRVVAVSSVVAVIATLWAVERAPW
ncbi:MAG: HupE/UreJ family protein [Longimicrobiaceae bacterium]